MPDAVTSLPAPRGFGQTTRPDAWWTKPLAVFLGFSTFVVYSTWAAFQGEFYVSGPYLSPFYSPEIFGDSSHAALRSAAPPGWPGWLPFSPAFLILLWAPVGFRLHMLLLPGRVLQGVLGGSAPSCAVGEPRSGYRGRAPASPSSSRNVHRYFLVFALALLVFLSHDAWKGFWFEDPATGAAAFGVGVGSLVLVLNVVLLGGYTLGCHSLRHFAGGRLTQISKRPAQAAAYRCVSCLNRRHMMWGVAQPRMGRLLGPLCPDCARWGSGRTSGSSDGRLPDPRVRRPRRRCRGCGPPGGHRGFRTGRAGRRRLEVASRQGAHRHGRGRRGRRDGECGRA